MAASSLESKAAALAAPAVPEQSAEGEEGDQLSELRLCSATAAPSRSALDDSAQTVYARLGHARSIQPISGSTIDLAKSASSTEQLRFEPGSMHMGIGCQLKVKSGIFVSSYGRGHRKFA